MRTSYLKHLENHKSCAFVKLAQQEIQEHYTKITPTLLNDGKVMIQMKRYEREHILERIQRDYIIHA
jgi:hypothetical protein